MEALKDKPSYELVNPGQLIASVNHKPKNQNAHFTTQIPCITDSQSRF